MNVETNSLCPESFKPVYSVKYEMVVFYLSCHFQDYLRYHPPSIEYHLLPTRLFDNYNNFIFEKTTYKFIPTGLSNNYIHIYH